MKAIKKNLKLILIKSKLAIMEYFEYRTSLFFYTLGSFTWSLGGVLTQKFLFDQIQILKGWTFGEIALLNAIYNFAFAFFIMFSWGAVYGEFRRAVREGGLDTVITKPMPHRLMLTFGSFDIVGFLHLIPSTAILILAFKIQAFHFGIIRVSLCLFYFLLGQFIINSIIYLFYASTFWLTSAEHISSAFWSIEGLSKTPLEILPKSLRIFLLTLIPIGFVAYIPTKALMGELSPWFLVYTIIFVIILELINRTVWKAGLRRYESVSS